MSRMSPLIRACRHAARDQRPRTTSIPPRMSSSCDLGTLPTCSERYNNDRREATRVQGIALNDYHRPRESRI